MFNIKLEENSYNMSFKALSVKYNVQKTDRVGGRGGATQCAVPRADSVNKLTSEDFTARLKQANLANKNDVYDFIKKCKF